MKMGRLFGIPVRIHPLALPMIALAVWLGEGRHLVVMTGSILLHELAHVGMARLLHVRVVEMELMPAGGAARLEDIWRLRPGQLTAVALAGPACSFVMMMFSAALCWWELLPPALAASMIEQNAVILAFNLLPALPMDGGRVLCGLLSRRLTAADAARIGVRTAQGIAVGLAALSVFSVLNGRLNVTIPIAAAFLFMSGRRELNRARISSVESLTDRARELESEGMLPVRWLAAGEETPVREMVARLKPRQVHLIAVYDDSLALTGVVSEEALIRSVLSDGDEKMGEMARNVKTKFFSKTY